MERIAILTVHTSPIAAPGGKKVGGMNTYIREIAQQFAQLGVQVDIYTRRTHPQEPAVDNSLGENVQVIHINAGGAVPMGTDSLYPHLQQFTAGVIAHTIKTNVRYNLIFSHYWLSGWVAQKLKEAWGTPFVQMFHTLGHMKNRIPSVTVPVPDVRIQVETQVVEWADLIIANTPAERAQLLWLYRADRRKICICPPGVNLKRFQRLSRTEARRALALPPDQPILLFVGRIEPLKAVDSILEALHLLREHNPQAVNDAKLIIIGGNPADLSDTDLQALIRQSQALKLSHTVEFLSAKDQNTLAYYYAAASAVVMPSEYESFGMVALEAMASGTPVIASEVGGLAYLIRDGQTGFLVPARSPENLAERIEMVLTRPALVDQLGRQAAHLAQSYDWANIARQLMHIFAELRTGKRSRRVS